MDADRYVLKRVKKSNSILDLGCIGDNDNFKSERNLHRRIFKINKNIVGVDINSEGITYLKKKGINIVNKNVNNFDLKRKFEFILCGNLIEHISNLDALLKNIKKHMNKETTLIIWTPNAYCFINFIAILFSGKRRINPGHVHWHSFETLKILLENYSLKITCVKFFNEKSDNNLINKVTLTLTRIMSFLRKAFSSTILIEVKIDEN